MATELLRPGHCRSLGGGDHQILRPIPRKTVIRVGINDSYRSDESDESKARRSGRKNSINLEDISDDYYRWANDAALCAA